MWHFYRSLLKAVANIGKRDDRGRRYGRNWKSIQMGTVP